MTITETTLYRLRALHSVVSALDPRKIDEALNEMRKDGAGDIWHHFETSIAFPPAGYDGIPAYFGITPKESFDLFVVPGRAKARGLAAKTAALGMIEGLIAKYGGEQL